LIKFSNGKQTQESLKIDFLETTFRETNMSLITCIIDVVTWKLLGKPLMFCL
jgi:hypothetical protein